MVLSGIFLAIWYLFTYSFSSITLCLRKNHDDKTAFNSVPITTSSKAINKIAEKDKEKLKVNSILQVIKILNPKLAIYGWMQS